MLLGDPRSPTACPFRRAPRSGHPTTSVSTRSACPFRRAPRSGHPTTSVSTRSACLFRRAPRSGHPTASVSTRSACPFSHRCPHAAPCSMSCRRPALNPARSCPPATVGVPHSPVPLPLPGIRESPAGDVHIRHGPRLIRPCRYLFREPPAGDLPTRRGPPHSSTPCRPLLRTAGVPRKGPAHPQGSGPRSPTPCRPLLRTAGVPRKGPAHPLQSERLAHPCRHLLRHLEPPAGDLLTRRSQCVSLSRTVPPPLRTLVGRRSHWLTATVSGPLPHTASAPPPSTREPRARSRALMTAEGLPPPPPRSRFHPPEITSGESREARVADNLIHPQSAC